MGEKRKGRMTNNERSVKYILNLSLENIFFVFRTSKKEKKAMNSVTSSASNDDVCSFLFLSIFNFHQSKF
jgi:hypothetical protein